MQRRAFLPSRADAVCRCDDDELAEAEARIISEGLKDFCFASTGVRRNRPLFTTSAGLIGGLDFVWILL